MTAPKTPPRKDGGSKPKAVASAKPADTRTARQKYADAIAGPFQLISGALLVLAPKEEQSPYHADAAAILKHGGRIAEDVADLAVADERLGALLDRVASAGPYGALILSVSALATQICANHGVGLRAGQLGTQSAEDLIAEVLGEVGPDVA